MAKEILYEYSVYKEIEVEKREQDKGADGVPFEKIVKVKESSPVRVIIYKPSYKQTIDANFEYGKYLNRLTGEGFLTRAMLAKKYAKEGIFDATFGTLSKEEARYLNNLYFELDKIRNESIRLGAIKEGRPDLQAEWEECRKKDSALRNEIVQIESQYRNLFQHTADAKAEYHEILWYALNLTHIQDNKDAPIHPYFKGETFAEKLDDYYTKEDIKEDIHTQIIARLFIVLGYWYHTGASSKDDFSILDEQFEKEKKE